MAAVDVRLQIDLQTHPLSVRQMVPLVALRPLVFHVRLRIVGPSCGRGKNATHTGEDANPAGTAVTRLPLRACVRRLPRSAMNAFFGITVRFSGEENNAALLRPAWR